MRRSADGLMDSSLPAESLEKIESLLAAYRLQGLDFHALRTMTLHILVPGHWTVQAGHDWAERIEADIRNALPHTHVTTHMEPLEDPLSMSDQSLYRNIGILRRAPLSSLDRGSATGECFKPAQHAVRWLAATSIGVRSTG